MLFAFLLLACMPDEVTNIRPANPSGVSDPDPLTIVVDATIRYQQIAGFGGANRMWGSGFLQTAEAGKAFGLDEDGLGLSIFRTRIPSDRNEWPLLLPSAQAAQQYGVKIMAAPWSPPAALKSNNSTVGGHLLPEHYAAFKDYLNEYISYMAANGVDIYAVSVQNEPDVRVSYESCDWSTEEMIAFVGAYGDQIVGAQLAAPESFNFNPEMTNAMLTDATVAANFDLLAGHIYGGGLGDFPLAAQQGKEIWMTEYLLNLDTGEPGAAAWRTYSEAAIWDESIEMLETVHAAMTHNWNAYLWWYLQRYYSFIGDGTEGTTNGAILKRGYAFSHFSRFVRPGFTRIAAQASRSSDLLVTAYDGPDELVLVLINPAASAVDNVELLLPGTTGDVQAWVTSLQDNRVAQAVVSLAEGRVSPGVIPGKGILTIVAAK